MSAPPLLALPLVLLLGVAACGGAAGAGAGAAAVGSIHARMGYSEDGGLRVVEVPAGPASEAGLRAGDRIVRIDDELVRHYSLEEIVAMLRGPVGSSVELVVVRDGEMQTLRVVRVPFSRR